MGVFHSQRKLSNVKLTREYHYRHMGLWIVLMIGLVILLNLSFHLFVRERWRGLSLSGEAVSAEYLSIRDSLMAVQVVEIVLFGAGIVLLAKFTSHRIAGPFLRLRRAFQDVRDGNLDHSLKFRQYDHLTHLENAFNEMMAAVRAKVKEAASTVPGEEAQPAVMGDDKPPAI